MKKESISKIFLILVSIYITLILVSNVLAGRLLGVFGCSLSVAVIIFPFTYIISDIFTEVYGFNKNKKVIWLGFLCNLIMVLLFMLLIKLPYPEGFENAEAYEVVLGTTPRILIASLIGFLVGSFLNSMVLSKLKIVTKGKFLALRTITSTIIGEGIDTLIFSTIVFIGILPVEVLIGMIIGETLLKTLIEVVFTPVTYKVISKIKLLEEIDVYDKDIKYSVI